MPDPLAFPRRALILGAAAALAVLPLAGAQAQAAQAASSRIRQVAQELTGIVNSGGTVAAMSARFEQVLARHADMPTIARSALGPAARQASAAQLQRFTAAYQGYLARKYGRMLFGSYSAGEVEVTGVSQSGTVISVSSVARMRLRAGGSETLRVEWQVSERSPDARFFNMVIDGVNLLRIEREEVPALLNQRRGDVDRLTADLAGMG